MQLVDYLGRLLQLVLVDYLVIQLLLIQLVYLAILNNNHNNNPLEVYLVILPKFNNLLVVYLINNSNQSLLIPQVDYSVNNHNKQVDYLDNNKHNRINNQLQVDYLASRNQVDYSDQLLLLTFCLNQLINPQVVYLVLTNNRHYYFPIKITIKLICLEYDRQLVPLVFLNNPSQQVCYRIVVICCLMILIIRT